MTTPPAPPAPPADPPKPNGGPPEPPSPPPPEPPAPTAADLARIQASLDAERKARVKAEADLAKLQRDGMSEHDRAVNEAREQGRAEAAAEHARALAAAEFRAQAAGKIADPDAALELLDLAKLVKDGKPDTAAIAAAVGRLAAVPPPPGRIPPGPREPAGNGGRDWLGDAARSAKGM